MHEFSLAVGLMTQLEQLARKHNATKIKTVRVDIGKLSGIVADSFSFGFEVLSKEHPLTEGVVLELTELAPQLNCLDCDCAFPLNQVDFLCPQCGSSRLRRTGADDLVLTQVEME